MAALSVPHYPPDPRGMDLRPDINVARELRVAAQVPDREVLIEDVPGGHRWTYSALLADAERCAEVLLDHFEPGERVGVWAHLPEWVILECSADRGNGAPRRRSPTGDPRALAIGEGGKLWERGYSTMIEYFDNSEPTAETLRSDG